MEKYRFQNLSEGYKDQLRRCETPGFTIITAIDAITECSHAKQDLLNIFQEKIRYFGIKNLSLMQKTIFDFEQRLLSQRPKIFELQKRRLFNKKVSACQDVAISLATTALGIIDSTSS